MCKTQQSAQRGKDMYVLVDNSMWRLNDEGLWERTQRIHPTRTESYVGTIGGIYKEIAPGKWEMLEDAE